MTKRIQTTFYSRNQPRFVIYSDEPYTTVHTEPPEFERRLRFMGLAKFQVISDSGDFIELDKDKDPYTYIENFWRHFYGWYTNASRPEIVEVG